MLATNPACKTKKFHLWLPNVFGFKGGIQVYSAFFVEALQRLYPKAEYDIFLKHDTQCLESAYLPQTCFHLAGGAPLPIRTPFFATQLLTRGSWQKPDLVITTHLNFTVAAYWLKRFAGIPYWTIAHGIEAWNIQNSALQTALRHADKILAVSNYTRDRLLKEQNLDPSKVLILPNTFDSSRFNVAPKPKHLLQRYQLNPKQPVILTVARLTDAKQYKGYIQILKALPEIRQRLPNVHYIIAGTGDGKPQIEQLVSQLNLQTCVTLAGFVPDDDLCDHYNLCDAFAMPSKREGFGIVYLEALACGKPTLGGTQDGAVDALGDGELGALVDPDDIDAIAQTLVQILQGSYPKPIMYQPEALRHKVIKTFGFERFQTTLGELMDSSMGVEL